MKTDVGLQFWGVTEVAFVVDIADGDCYLISQRSIGMFHAILSKDDGLYGGIKYALETDLTTNHVFANRARL